jgi:hypothetical protein
VTPTPTPTTISNWEKEKEKEKEKEAHEDTRCTWNRWIEPRLFFCHVASFMAGTDIFKRP